MEVKLGMSPISWTNDDLPELGGDTSLETCLKETRLAGFSGTELGGKFPKNPSSLKEVLEEHELKLISGWYSGTMLNNNLKDEKIKLSLIFSSCLLYTSPSPRDRTRSRMPSSA